MRNFWISWWWGIGVCLLAGCGSLHADYVAADRETFKYAEPKLEQWARDQGDPEWEKIVNDKGVSWEARIKRAEKKLKEDEK